MSRPPSNRKRRGRGEGGVRKTSNGLWEASLSLGMRSDGKRYRIHAYGKTKKEALDKLRELQQQPRSMRGDKTTVAGYIDIWLADKARSVARSTHDRYTQVAKYAAQYLGHLSMKDVGPPHIRQWYTDMTQDNVSKSNQSKAAQLLGMVFSSAMADQVCIANPVIVVPRPKPDHREITVLSPAQIKTFLQAADSDRMFALYNVALATGARLGELLALEWRDINFEAGTVTFQRAASEVRGAITIKDTKTVNGRRTVQLARFAVEALHEHRKQCVLEGLASIDTVFASKRGTYMRRSNIHKNHFKPTLKRAGVPSIRFHDLRHSAATWLLSLGATPKDVSAILGHASAAFTIQTYTHTSVASQTTAINRMDDLLG